MSTLPIIPLQSPISDKNGTISQVWAGWFRQFKDSVAAIAIAAAAGIGTPWEGTPTDTGDHVNFTVPHTPLEAFTFQVFRNGLRQQLTAHYTRTGPNFALSSVLDPTQEDLYVEFHY
ncbi:MAG: hypothetical protein V4568_14675 [Pseudomonadota bacterium]